MAELIRTIAGRLRELVGNNRRAPRREARLHVSVVPLDARARATGGVRRASQLEGHTRDLSATGLAFVVPAIHVGGRYLTGEDRKLRIALDLPPGPVQFHASPVRYERLDEDETGYLIGAHIMEMTESDRALRRVPQRTALRACFKNVGAGTSPAPTSVSPLRKFT